MQERAAEAVVNSDHPASYYISYSTLVTVYCRNMDYLTLPKATTLVNYVDGIILIFQTETQRKKWLIFGRLFSKMHLLEIENNSWFSTRLWVHVQLFEIPWTVAHQAPMSMGFFRQEYWSGEPFPSPRDLCGDYMPDHEVKHKTRTPAFHYELSIIRLTKAFLVSFSH